MGKSHQVTPLLRAGKQSYSATFYNARGKRITRGLRTTDLCQAQLLCAALVRLRQQHVQSWAQAGPELLREVPPAALELYLDEPRRDQPGAVLASADDVLASLPAMAAHAAPFPANTQAKAVVLLYERDKLLREVQGLRQHVAEFGLRLAQAERKRHDLERSALGRATMAAQHSPNLDDAIEQFCAHIPSVMSSRNAQEHVRALQHFRASLPPVVRSAADVLPSHVVSFLDQRCAQGDPSRRLSRRRAWRLKLVRFFSWLATSHGVPSVMTSVPTVSKQAVLRERGDIQWHSLEEVQAAIAALPDEYWKALVGTLAYAGLQMAEMVWLRKTDVEFYESGARARFWVTTVADPVGGSRHLLKTGQRRRHVDVHPRCLLPLIRRQLSFMPDSAWLFPFPSGRRRRPREADHGSDDRWLVSSLSVALRGHAGGSDKAKRPPTPPLLPKGMNAKSLRRTFGSLLLRSGKSTAEVAAAMGNTEDVVRQHYARILGSEVEVDF